MFEVKPEPQDIFADEVESPASSIGQIVSDRHLGTGGHVWKTILIVMIAFLAAGLLAYTAFSVMRSDTPTVANGDNEVTDDQDQDSVNLPDGKGEEVEIVIDTDGDGLSNQAEQAAGTNPAKTDTDGDSLGDREEVQVYGTDPLRADTDSDSFSDGEEIRSGYNPNGAGKILELPTN